MELPSSPVFRVLVLVGAAAVEAGCVGLLGGPSSGSLDGGASGDAGVGVDGGVMVDGGVGVLAPPGALRAVAGDGQVALTWAAAPGASSYRVKRSTGVVGPPFSVLAEVGTLAHLDPGLPNGTTQYYVVSSVGAGGESADGAPVSATPDAAPSCFVAEVCGNGADDDCDGTTDETACLSSEAYLADWKMTGQVVDWVLFGEYPLYQETQAARGLVRQSWGQGCIGQTGSPTPLEESSYCLGATTDFLEWQMKAPAAGTFVLMLAPIPGGAAHRLELDRGQGFEALPAIDGSRAVVLLDHAVGGAPSSLFYLLRLPGGAFRLRVTGTSSYLELSGAVLAWLKAPQHTYPSPVYPHLHFTQARIDAIKAGQLDAEGKALLADLATQADQSMSVADLASLGRERAGVLDRLAASGVLNSRPEHLRKAIELLRGHAAWLAQQDGDYVSGDILEYGYDLRQLGTAWDLVAPHLATVLSQEETSTLREQLSVELMRHALANVSGNWWRLPRQGGWTSSMAQAGKLSLALVGDDKLARFHLDVSLLMYKTSLRDNLTEDGAYLQALGQYYGWDYWNLASFLHALGNNPGLSEDLWAYGDSALRRYYHWLLYSLAPSGRCLGPFGTEQCSGYFYGDMLSTLSLAAGRYQDGAIEWMHDALTGPGRSGVLVSSALVESLAWRDSAPAPVEPSTVLPLGKVTRGNEHVFMRTGWGLSDWAYSGRCGLAGNHSQREHGSFILYADGHNYVQAYNNYEADTELLTQSSDKNFVTIDGKGQAVGAPMSARMAEVTSFLHSPTVDYAACDSTAAYNADPSDATSMPVDFALRRTLFVRPSASGPGYYVVLDRLRAHDGAAHRYEFQLHPGCRVQTGQSAGDCVDPIAVQAPGAPVYTLAPVGAPQRLAILVAEPAAAAQVHSVSPMPIAGFPPVLRLRAAADGVLGEFAVVLFPEDASAGRSRPPFTRLSLGPGLTGFTLGEDTLLWSRDGAALAHSSIAAVGAAVLVRGATTPTEVALFEGTSLSLSSVRHLALSAPGNAVMRWSGAGRTITVGNEMSAAAVELEVGGLVAGATYGVSVSGVGRADVTADATGAVRLVQLGPAATTVELTPR